MSDPVVVDRSISGAYWRMRYKGKVAFEEDEPTPATKEKFRKSVDAGPQLGLASYDTANVKASVTQADR